MKRTIIIAVALILFIAGVAAAARFTTSSGSIVRVQGTSTLHEWTMEGQTIEGQITAPVIEQWQNGKAATAVSISIPVTSIKSQHAKMDKLMAEALKAKENPVIRYEVTEALLEKGAPQAFTLKARGKLTIAGTTREVEMQVGGSRNPSGSYVLTGEVPIRMSDFGIKPPTAMLGTIKTGNDVKVNFRWVVEATN